MKKGKGFVMVVLSFMIFAMLIPNDVHALFPDENEEIPVYMEIIDVFSKKEFNELFKEEEYEMLKGNR